MAGDYHIEDIYGGGFSSLDPDKSGYFTGYRIPVGKFSLATDPRTANILQEVSQKLQSGAKQIEVSAIQPDVFESIPNQQLTEVKRLSKLTGVDVSLHGILVEPSGINTQQGYNELAREEAERQMLSNVMRGHELSPEGNIPVTFHSSHQWPGAEYRPVKNEKGEVEFEKWKMPIINQETGQIQMTESDTMYIQGMTKEELKEGEKRSALDHVRMRNATEWENSLAQIEFNRESANRILQDVNQIFVGKYMQWITRQIPWNSFSQEEQHEIQKVHSAAEYVKQAGLNMQSIFNRAYKYGDDEEKKKLSNLSEQYGNAVGLFDLDENGNLKNPNSYNPLIQSKALFNLGKEMSRIRPQIWKPAEDFAVEKSAETFGNVAFGAYQKFKDTAPVISIENPPAGGGLSRAEDLQNLVEASRKQFVKRAMAEGISEGTAQEQANKLIGVTWDVGHINMIRKFGYSEEDTLKEAKKIAPFVKHVHLSDNFGYEHTELPMGMGNVPIAEVMKRLGEKGFEARKVIEAGNWFQHFKTAPFQETLEAFGSPIYGMKMAPYWNQSIGTAGYFGGYGNMLPQINYETMGAGFSMLPSELGGQRGGAKGSRMSGRPME